MTDPTRPTTPEPTTPAAALRPAAPCARCARTDGYDTNGNGLPSRMFGYCLSCYQTLRQAEARWGFWGLHQANAAIPYLGHRGENPHQRHAHSCAQGRAWGRQAALLAAQSGFLPPTIPTLPNPPGDTTPALLMRHSKAWRDGEALDRARDWHTMRPTTPGGAPIALATDDAARAA